MSTSVSLNDVVPDVREVDDESRASSISDNTAKLCAVCKDVANGIHFGALTCEGCKGFFRRSVKKNSSYRCSLQNQCILTKESRKHCQACRFQACLSAGMRSDLVLSDEDVIKKRELIKANREKRAEKQKSKKCAQEQERLKRIAEQSSVHQQDIRMTMEEKLTLENLLKSHALSYDFGYEEYDTFRGKETIKSPSRDGQGSSSQHSFAWLVASMPGATDVDSSSSTDDGKSVSASCNENASPVVQAEPLNSIKRQENLDVFSSLHGTSSSPNQSNINKVQSSIDLSSSEATSVIPGMGSSEDDSLSYLHHLLRSQGISLEMVQNSKSKQLLQHFCDIMTWGIKKVIEFCKNIPQFCTLSLQDQIVLLKGGCLELLVLRSYFAFSSSENKYMSDKFQYDPSDFLQAGGDKDFIEKYNNLHLRMRKMKLQVEEICLLLALVLFSPDRPGLQAQETVEQIQDNIAKTLYAYEHTHKPAKQAQVTYCELLLILPILRTINMLFSSNLSSLQETNENDMNSLILEVNSPSNESV